MFGSAGLAYATAALTVTTLFFGELLPKALGVNNAEVVARRILPVIIVLSVVLNPVARTFTLISKVFCNRSKPKIVHEGSSGTISNLYS